MEATEELEPTSGDILPASGRPQRRYHVAMYVALAVAGLTVLGVAAGVAWSRHSEQKASVPVPPATRVPMLTVDPPSGAKDIRPDAKVTVTANRGRLTSVHVVDGGGNEVAGTLAPFGKSWTSTGTLYLARGYKVTSEVAGVSKTERPVARTSEFTTIRPAGLLGPRSRPATNRPSASANRSSSTSTARSP